MNDRFWSKVENSSGASCWQWLGYTSGNGYGHFGIKRNGKHITVGAHCVAWELRFGPIPEGMFVCHRAIIRDARIRVTFFLAMLKSMPTTWWQRGEAARARKMKTRS
jgi:hypothetical protein